MGKRIKVPVDLQLEALFASMSGELASLEGVVKTSVMGGLTKWKFVRAKGGWQYLGSFADMSFKQKGYAVIPDASDDEASPDAAEMHRSSQAEVINRIASDVQDIKAQVSKTWNYTMLSFDNRVLKIGETRWDKEDSELKAELEKRYRQKKEKAKGGPFHYISHKSGTDKTEAAALAWLDKCGVKPLYGKEYFPSHEALKALRQYGEWCLGEWGTEGGFLPKIQDAEQGKLLPESE